MSRTASTGNSVSRIQSASELLPEPRSTLHLLRLDSAVAAITDRFCLAGTGIHSTRLIPHEITTLVISTAEGRTVQEMASPENPEVGRRLRRVGWPLVSSKAINMERAVNHDLLISLDFWSYACQQRNTCRYGQDTVIGWSEGFMKRRIRVGDIWIRVAQHVHHCKTSRPGGAIRSLTPIGTYDSMTIQGQPTALFLR